MRDFRGLKEKPSLRPPIKQTKQNNNILAIMNKILTTAAPATLGISSYESPAITAVEVLSEGVLCMSGKMLEEWDTADTFKWDE